MTVYNKVAEHRLDEEQHQQAAGEVRNSRQASGQRQSVHTDDNVDTVESLLLSQEDKPQSHQTVREISREAEGGSSVLRIIHKDLHLKCGKKSRAQQLTEEHSMHVLFSVGSSRDDNVIASKPI